MAQVTGNKGLDRRGFLKGSALFAAAAVGLTAVSPVFGQEPAPSKPEEKAPEQPAGDQAKKEDPSKPADPNKLVDKSGREYRVCERCGGNMYKEGKTWTCEQCGLSYDE
jgi:anaerobic selenocysteine-containing dehydrogenase